MEISSEKIVEIASYFKPIHHTPGRLRVRVNPRIKELSKETKVEDVESMVRNISGIKEVKINKAIASITITYDPVIFPKQMWDDLIERKNLDEITKKINALYKEIV